MKVFAPELTRPRKSNLVRKYEKVLRGTRNIDPHILAAQLGLQVRTVCTMQRKIGERDCVDPHAPKED